MANFGEPVFGQVFIPMNYWDVTYGMSLPVRGIGGAMQVVMAGWDGVALTPQVANVSSAGSLQVADEKAATATITSVNSLATSQQILAANTARKGAVFYNSDANSVRLKYGAVAAAGSFSVIIAPATIWAMPEPIYTGRIDAIWDADGAGALITTEM